MDLSLSNCIKRTAGFLGALEKGVMVLLLLLLIGFALLQIVLRNFFATGILWADTFQRHLVLWVSLLGAARATAENRHIRIDLLPRLLPPRASSAVASAADLIASAICAVLVFASWRFVLDERSAGATAFAGVPFWWLEVIFPFSFAVMALRFAFHFYSSLLPIQDDAKV